MAVVFRPFKGRSRSVGVKIEGLNRALVNLKKLEINADSVLMLEMFRAGTRIAKRANRDVPVDTGKLSRSINVKRSGRNVDVRVTAPYAGYVESGTSRMRAQPYIIKHIRPALDQLTRNLATLKRLYR